MSDIIPADHRKMIEIILMELEGTAGSEQSEQLQRWLKSTPGAVDFYTDMVMLYSGISQPGHLNLSEIIDLDSQAILNDSFWLELSRHEKIAPEIPAQGLKKDSSDEKLPLLTVERPAHKVNKFSLVTALVSAAALILVLLYAHFVPSSYSYETATITDGINTVWQSEGSIGIGKRLMTNQKPLRLEKGIVQILFDNRAEIAIEAPAEFRILTDEQLQLNYGRLYASIPQEALGFSVNTPNSKIVDLGTEFGIDVNTPEHTEVHVINGKTNLYYGEGKSKQVSLVSEGFAKKVSAATGMVDIPCQDRMFVRRIQSENHFIWKGESISLASLVAGGNGFSKGNIVSGIDPAAGQVNEKAIQAYERTGRQTYSIMSDRPFIDGVFVPNGSYGANVVSSAGHAFEGFPQTENRYWGDITANPYMMQRSYIDKAEEWAEETLVALEQPGANPAANHPLILMHANSGITFDLQKIRQAYEQLQITQFRAVCGVAKNVPKQMKTEFWVLLDGECVFHYEVTDPAAVHQIDIPITDHQRFLTLATTDGRDQINYDWDIFAEPQLMVKSKLE